MPYTNDTENKMKFWRACAITLIIGIPFLLYAVKIKGCA